MGVEVVCLEFNFGVREQELDTSWVNIWISSARSKTDRERSKFFWPALKYSEIRVEGGRSKRHTS